MEALTLRGLQETDTVKPEDRKSENGKSETEDGNSKSCSRRNLSKDYDGGSDPERTSRDRHDQARGQEIREWEIVNWRRKLEMLFMTESKQRSWWRLWHWEDFKRQTRSSQTTGNQRKGNRKPKTETRNPVLDRINAKIMMEALTLRGLQETDTIKPDNGKSDKGKS